MAHELVGKFVKINTASGNSRTGRVLDISEGLMKMSFGDNPVWVSTSVVEELTILDDPKGTQKLATLPRIKTAQTGLR